MADSVEALEAHIQRYQRSLETNLGELQLRAATAADWHTHYRAHIGAAIGAALVGGVVVGALTGGHRASSLRNGPVGHIATRAVDALLATAMAAAVGFVADLVPGFGDEFRARSSSNL